MAIEQMTIETLHDLIEKHITSNQLKGPVLSLSETDFFSEKLSKLFNAFLADHILVIDDVKVTKDGTTITVSGRGSGTPFDGLAVKAVFGLDDKQQITLSLLLDTEQTLTANWTLAQRFPALMGTIYEHITFTDPWLSLSTEDSGTIKQGLFFRGTLDLGGAAAFSGPLDPFNAFWQGASSLQLSGSITLSDGIPTMHLLAEQTWSWSTRVGYFDLPLKLNLKAELNKTQVTSSQRTLDAAIELVAQVQSPVAVLLSANYQTGQSALTFTANVTHLINAKLEDLVSFIFDRENALATLPTGLSLKSLLTQAVASLSVDIQSRTLQSVTLDIERADAWDAFAGTARLQQVHVALRMDHPLDKQSRIVTCTVAGNLQIAQALTFVATLNSPDFTGTGVVKADGSQGVSLTQVVAHALGIRSVPQEVPDFIFDTLAVTYAPAQGRFHLKGQSATALPLPFGVSDLLVSDIELGLEREAATTKATLNIQQTWETPVLIAEHLSFTQCALAFQFDAAKQEWNLSGRVDALIFDSPAHLAVSLQQRSAVRTLLLTATDPTFPPLDLGNGSITFHDLVVQISKSLDTASVGMGLRLDKEQKSAYTWQVNAVGNLEMAHINEFALSGKIALWDKDGSVGLKFKPLKEGSGETTAVVQVTLPLPGYPQLAVTLGLDYLTIVKDKQGWSIDTVIDLMLTIPDKLRQALPTTMTTAHLSVSAEGVQVTVSPLVMLHSFALPPAQFANQRIDLGTLAIAVPKLELRLDNDVQLTSEFALGLPASLNDIFGTKPVFHVFKSYHEGDENTLIHLTLSLDAKHGVQIQFVDAPINAIQPAPAYAQDTSGDPVYRICIGNGAEFGALDFTWPTFSFDGGSFKAHGFLRQAKDAQGNPLPLKLPLVPLKLLLQALHLDVLNNAIPRGLPLKELHLLNSDGTFHGQGIVAALNEIIADISNDLHTPSFSLGDDIEHALVSFTSSTNTILEKMPQSLKDSLDIAIPEMFIFSIAISDSGAVQIDINVDEQHPIKVLYPTLGPLGPQLNSLFLRSFSLGELFGGALLSLTADMDVYQFPLVTLIAALSLPEGASTVLPKTQRLITHLPVHNLFMVITTETGIPVPVPIFFDQLGLEYLGLEGVSFQALGGFPNPLAEHGTANLLTVLTALGRFFTDPAYELPTTLPGILPQLIVGPNHLQLPAYMGSKQLIAVDDPHFNTTVSTQQPIIHMLNALKQLNLDSLLRAIPLSRRIGTTQLSFAGFDLAEMDWLITTPGEFSALTSDELASTHLTIDDRQPLLQILPASQATTQIDGLQAHIAATTKELQTLQTQVQSLLSQERAMLPTVQNTQSSIAQLSTSVASELTQEQAQAGRIGRMVGNLTTLVATQEQLVTQLQTQLPALHNQLAAMQRLFANVPATLSSIPSPFIFMQNQLKLFVQTMIPMDAMIADWLQQLQLPIVTPSSTFALQTIREQLPQLQTQLHALLNLLVQLNTLTTGTALTFSPQAKNILASLLAQVAVCFSSLNQLNVLIDQLSISAQWSLFPTNVSLFPEITNQLQLIQGQRHILESLLMALQNELDIPNPFVSVQEQISMSAQTMSQIDTTITDWLQQMQNLQVSMSTRSLTATLTLQETTTMQIYKQFVQLRDQLAVLQKNILDSNAALTMVPQAKSSLESLLAQVGTFSSSLSQISDESAQLASMALSTTIAAQERMLQQVQAQLPPLQSWLTTLQHEFDTMSVALEDAAQLLIATSGGTFATQAQVAVQSIKQMQIVVQVAIQTLNQSITAWQQQASLSTTPTTWPAHIATQEALIEHLRQMPQLQNQLTVLQLQISIASSTLRQALQQVINADNTTLAHLTSTLNQTRATAQSTGLVLLLRGQVLDALTLDFGLSVSRLGVGIGAALRGKISDLFELEVNGLVVVDPHASPIFRVLLNGMTAIPAFDISERGTLIIDAQGFDLTLDGQLFGKTVLAASLHLSGSNLQDGETCTVTASFHNNLIGYMEQIIRNELQDIATKANNAIAPLRNKAQQAQQDAQDQQAKATSDLHNNIENAKRDIDGAVSQFRGALNFQAIEQQALGGARSFDIPSLDTPGYTWGGYTLNLPAIPGFLGWPGYQLPSQSIPGFTIPGYHLFNGLHIPVPDVVGAFDLLGKQLHSLSDDTEKIFDQAKNGFEQIVNPQLLENVALSGAKGALYTLANDALQEAMQLNSEALSAFDYIASHTLDQLVSIESATFSGSFNAVKGEQIILQLELAYQGQHHSVSINFDLSHLEISANTLAHTLMTLM